MGILIHMLFYQFINNFSALLLCKINKRDILDRGDYFQILLISRSTEILIESTLNGLTKVTFVLFCYFFEKRVSEYLHETSKKNVLNLIFIIGIL